VEHLEERPGAITFEVIPPMRGGDIRALEAVVQDLAVFRPPFIDVTCHASEAHYEEMDDGTFERVVTIKRPGTLGICALIQAKYKIDAVPHLLCAGFTRDETEDMLVELNFIGVRNVLAIRGDEHIPENLTSGERNRYAVALVRQIRDLQKGRYVRTYKNPTPMDFNVGVAGYPEKHFEAPNRDTDIRYLKEKIDAGASYVVTQMFFDNEKYFSFVRACRERGIEVPIIPGLKVLTSATQLRTIPRMFHCDLPVALTDEVLARPDEVRDIGVAWAAEQVRALLDGGAPSVHFYVMQSAKPVQQVLERFSYKP